MHNIEMNITVHKIFPYLQLFNEGKFIIVKLLSQAICL